MDVGWRRNVQRQSVCRMVCNVLEYQMNQMPDTYFKKRRQPGTTTVATATAFTTIHS